MVRRYSSLILFLALFAAILVGCRGGEPANEPPTDDRLELLWPAAGETVSPSPDLQWVTFVGAATYQVTVQPRGESQVVFEGTTSDTHITPSPPLAEGDYLWTVEARDADGKPLDQSSNNFHVAAQLVVVAPADGAQVGPTPELRWQPYSGAVQYDVTVVLADAFPAEAVFQQITDGTSVTVSPPLEPGDYVWTVRAEAPDGTIIAQLDSAFTITQ
jgi:hypothetical protein